MGKHFAEFRTTQIVDVQQEDPFEDMRHLQLSSKDSMFVITSAGDNALHYAFASSPQRVGVSVSSRKTVLISSIDPLR